MSRYSKNKEACPNCGIIYKDFRCSLESLEDVYNVLYKPIDDPKQWRNKRLKGLLGYWFETKQKEWKDHIENCRKHINVDCATVSINDISLCSTCLIENCSNRKIDLTRIDY